MSNNYKQKLINNNKSYLLHNIKINMPYLFENLLEYYAYQTMPCAPDPIGFKF